MATNLALDDQLIDEAVQLGKHKTKREAVNAALEDYIKKMRQTKILDLMGTVEFRPDWDYKEDRKRSMKRVPKG